MAHTSEQDNNDNGDNNSNSNNNNINNYDNVNGVQQFALLQAPKNTNYLTLETVNCIPKTILIIKNPPK